MAEQNKSELFSNVGNMEYIKWRPMYYCSDKYRKPNNLYRILFASSCKCCYFIGVFAFNILPDANRLWPEFTVPDIFVLLLDAWRGISWILPAPDAGSSDSWHEQLQSSDSWHRVSDSWHEQLQSSDSSHLFLWLLARATPIFWLLIPVPLTPGTSNSNLLTPDTCSSDSWHEQLQSSDSCRYNCFSDSWHRQLHSS